MITDLRTQVELAQLEIERQKRASAATLEAQKRGSKKALEAEKKKLEAERDGWATERRLLEAEISRAQNSKWWRSPYLGLAVGAAAGGLICGATVAGIEAAR